MKVLIFNSGVGKRMGEFTEKNHKSMAQLTNGETIFERQIRILSELGIKEFVITTGNFEDQLVEKTKKQAFEGLDFTIVENPIYYNTNYIYSMYLARDFLNDDIIMIHGDLVFNREYAKKIIEDTRENLGSVNKKISLPEKDFKARIIDGKIKEISVNIFDENCFAFQPFYKLSKDILGKWMEKVEEFIKSGNDKVYAENALNEITDMINIEAMSYENDFVDEIDNMDDLERVSKAIRTFDFKEQVILAEKDSYKEIEKILKKSNSRKPMIVGKNTFKKSKLKEYLDSLSYDFVIFGDYSSNPKYEEVVAGVDLFRKEKCDFIIAVGGGSCLDTGKNIKLFAELNPEENYLKQKYQFAKTPLIAIPTTAGSGSESTRYSVLYFNDEKQSIAHDSIMPDFVILDERFLIDLPAYQRKSTILDAMCQCIESIWSVNTNDECRGYATKGARIVRDNIEQYCNGGNENLMDICVAANLSGRSINIAQSTAAHAMSYKLGSLTGISHGHSAALCLIPALELMIKVNSEKESEHVTEAFKLINQALLCKNIDDSLSYIKTIVKNLGLYDNIDFKEEYISILSKSVNPTRLANHPILMTEEEIADLYREIRKETL